MDKIITFWKEVINTIPLIGIAIIGSIIHWGKVSHSGGWHGLVLSMSTAGFGSMCVGFLTSAFPQIPYGVTLFLCGMIGYSGGTLVDYMLIMTKAKAAKIGEKVVGEKDIDEVSRKIDGIIDDVVVNKDGGINTEQKDTE